MYEISSNVNIVEFQNAKFEGFWIDDIKNGEFVEIFNVNLGDKQATWMKGMYRNG